MKKLKRRAELLIGSVKVGCWCVEPHVYIVDAVDLLVCVGLGQKFARDIICTPVVDDFTFDAGDGDPAIFWKDVFAFLRHLGLLNFITKEQYDKFLVDFTRAWNLRQLLLSS